MFYKLDNGQILKERMVGITKIKEAFCMHKNIEIKNATTNINTLTQIPITFQTFDLDEQAYIIDTQINKTVDVYVNGELATTEPIVNGEGVIQFESAEVGIFKIKVENSECEVVVNG